MHSHTSLLQLKHQTYFSKHGEGFFIKLIYILHNFYVGFLKKNLLSILPLFLETHIPTNKTKAGKCPSCEKVQYLPSNLTLFPHLCLSVSKGFLCGEAEIQFPVGESFTSSGKFACLYWGVQTALQRLHLEISVWSSESTEELLVHLLPSALCLFRA